MPRVPQSHMVMTTLRSMPCGRLGLRERQFAGGDAVGPVGEQLDRLVGADARNRDRHVGHGLSGLDAALPRLAGVLELAEQLATACARPWSRARGRTGRSS